nr:glycosyltransferase family A protein [Bradyrhizobium sp. WSM1743]
MSGSYRNPFPAPGPVRNRGIRETRGDIVAFIDADCREDPGWLAAIEAAFADRRTRIIGGDAQVSYEIPTRPTFLEPYEKTDALLRPTCHQVSTR